MRRRISVIMAAYNAAHTIEASIRSVLRQDIPDMELVVVNDGSTDNTLEVLAGIDTPCMRVITQENRGPAAARNRGLASSNGEYIACIDSDDIWLDGKLREQWQAIHENPRAEVAYGWADIVDADLRFVHRDRRATHRGDVYAELLRENFIISGSNSMVRRSVLEKVGGFDGSLRAVEDWELHVRLASECEFVNVPRVVVQYRKSENSLSSDTTLMEQSFLAARSKIFAVAPDKHRALEPKCTAAFSRYLATRSLQTMRAHKKPLKAFRYIRTAVRNDAIGSLRLFGLFNPIGPIRLAIRTTFRR